ncbi:hypothetical protein Tco_0861096 [Tanacetum coccineum]|uniref:Reverse transcriptase domain-containing protein n=1 Tax=Tanacetum coccineum TaxID=301880 RepID=A0ABQ5BKY3_9ASTR
MSTRSSSSNLVPPSSNIESIIQNRRRNLGDPSLLLDFEEINMANNNNNVQRPPPAGPNIPAPDLRPMKELLQAPTDGVGDAIVVPPCPHHGFFPLHQIDTFYNGLNQSDHDSLNSAAGGNSLTRNTQEALTIIENKSKVRISRNKPQVLSDSGSSSQNDAITALVKQVEALVSSMNKPIPSVQEGCETCGGPHPYYECQAVGGYTQYVYVTTRTYNASGALPFTEKLEDPADPRVPIILGRPFLRTAKALVDLYEEKLTLRVRERNEVRECDFYHKEFVDELAPIISPPEYDHFYFDLVDDPGELTRILKEK